LAESSDHRSREADLARHLDRDVSAGEAATVGRAETRGDFPLEEALRILEDADILGAPGSNANESEETG
jgi:hypothetical protein